jgi:uncharacterized protein YjbJ (UPF0337 family)
LPTRWNLLVVNLAPNASMDLIPQVISHEKKQVMNWDQVAGNWKQFKGNVKEKWGQLTDDDLGVIEGKKDQLVGRLEERYGYSKEQAEKELKIWD